MVNHVPPFIKLMRNLATQFGAQVHMVDREIRRGEWRRQIEITADEHHPQMRIAQHRLLQGVGDVQEAVASRAQVPGMDVAGQNVVRAIGFIFQGYPRVIVEGGGVCREIGRKLGSYSASSESGSGLKPAMRRVKSANHFAFVDQQIPCERRGIDAEIGLFRGIRAGNPV